VVTAEEEVVDGSGEVGRGGGVARSRSRIPDSFFKECCTKCYHFWTLIIVTTSQACRHQTTTSHHTHPAFTNFNRARHSSTPLHPSHQLTMNPIRLLVRSRPHWQPTTTAATTIAPQTPSSCHHHQSSSPYSTTPTLTAMKPGTKIPGLDSIYPKDPKAADDGGILSKPREEYPSWVDSLVKAPPTLAKLRSMKIEDASDREMKRYLKLVRRGVIKGNNSVASG
jgi:hypothetical protein